MLAVTIDLDLKAFERALVKAVGKEAREKALAKTLTRVAAAARVDVMGRLDKIFDRPTPFTVHSVRYEKATVDRLQSTVFISDDAVRGLSPRKYLGPEIEGGPRGFKRTEIALAGRQLLGTGQQAMPGRGISLDSFGNVPGSTAVQILSRVAAFGEQGYRANATAATRRRLVKKGVAVTANGFEFFVKRGKGGKPLGVYKVTSSGARATPGQRGTSVRATIAPALVFANARATYKPRFPFRHLVQDYVSRHFGEELVRALREGMK